MDDTYFKSVMPLQSQATLSNVPESFFGHMSLPASYDPLGIYLDGLLTRAGKFNYINGVVGRHDDKSHHISWSHWLL